jgi:hypothetical protein
MADECVLGGQAATLSHKLHVGGDPSEREELVERAKKYV